MSLINQVLKDLESRSATGAGDAHSKDSIKPVPARQGVSPVILGALIFGAAGLVVIWFWQPKKQVAPAPVVSPVVAPQAVPLPKQLPAPASAPQPADEGQEAAQTFTPRLPGLDIFLRTPPEETAAPTEKKSRGSRADPVNEPQVQPAVIPQPQPINDSLATTNRVPAQATEKRPTRSTSKTPSLKIVSLEQKSENLYKRAVSLLQEGRVAEARSMLWQSLDENPVNHDARQLLAGLLIDSKRNSDGMLVLRDGVRLAPDQIGFVMALARLQVAEDDRQGALETLENGVKYAGEDADYHGFYAALLQQADRHNDAVQHYISALASDPGNVSWLVGIGISLQALEKYGDAREAYQRARLTGQLTADLLTFVDRRLQQIKGK